LLVLLAGVTITGMKGEDLSRQQRERLEEQVRRQLRYLHRLTERMQRLGWAVNDPMWLEALRARDALQGLLAAVRYSGCSGVG
jgi:hypothetical protein